jgi:hypothetical protein
MEEADIILITKTDLLDTREAEQLKTEVNKAFPDAQVFLISAKTGDGMEEWMEYLYQQRSKPPNATGVVVTLDTVDPNGNYYNIGSVTSDSDGNYGYAFTPEVPGTYKIIATFAGSKSYGPSSATTYLAIGNAESIQPTETPQIALPPTELYFAISTVIIVAAIALVGLLLLRKRP